MMNGFIVTYLELGTRYSIARRKFRRKKYLRVHLISYRAISKVHLIPVGRRAPFKSSIYNDTIFESLSKLFPYNRFIMKGYINKRPSPRWSHWLWILEV